MQRTKRGGNLKGLKRGKVSSRSNKRKVVHKHEKHMAGVKTEARIKVRKLGIRRGAKNRGAVPRRQRKPIPQPGIAVVVSNAAINTTLQDPNFLSYITRSVGKRAVDILTILATPQTDEAIAEKLEIKINEVRRMLNTLNTFGVTRYNVNKDSRGWLTFKWYIDMSKLDELKEQIAIKNEETRYKIPEGNDFFICDECYSKQKTIFPFETAFEMNFKCDCGKPMRRVDRVDVKELVATES